MAEKQKQRSYEKGFWALAWQKMRRDPMAMVGLGIVSFLFILAFFAPIIANNKPIVMSWKGKTYYPAVAEMFPFSLWMSYPKLSMVDFERHKTDPKVARLMPPIPQAGTIPSAHSSTSSQVRLSPLPACTKPSLQSQL